MSKIPLNQRGRGTLTVPSHTLPPSENVGSSVYRQSPGGAVFLPPHLFFSPDLRKNSTLGCIFRPRIFEPKFQYVYAGGVGYGAKQENGRIPKELGGHKRIPCDNSLCEKRSEPNFLHDFHTFFAHVKKR